MPKYISSKKKKKKEKLLYQGLWILDHISFFLFCYNDMKHFTVILYFIAYCVNDASHSLGLLYVLYEKSMYKPYRKQEPSQL